MLQTHVSALFFAGDRVYKVKKPLRLEFLDFSTLQRRRFFCREEVRLNERLAPGVYLGVVPIARLPSGTLRVGDGAAPAGAEELIEYAVEMRRLPQERMLERLLERGTVDNACIDRLVDVLVRFHREAATGPGVDEQGLPDAVGRVVRRNLVELRAFAGPAGPFLAALHRRLWDAAESFLRKRRALLEARVREGRVREGHGDLHAGNICLTEGGIVIYDRIEFDAALRCGDTARDLAFLVMDLDYRGHRGLGRYVALRYSQATADPTFEQVLPFYKRHYAAVRAKVNAIAAGDAGLDSPLREDARREALRYFHLAAGYLVGPALLVMCGLPGSGKSHTARAIARALGAAIIHSDVVRKRLAGIAATRRVPAERVDEVYGARMSQETYDAMLRQAGALLAEGRPVVADATFPHERSRTPFLELAASRSVPWSVVYLHCPQELIERRLAARGRDPGEYSDADLEVYRKAAAHFEPPHEAGAHLLALCGADDPEPAVGLVLEKLLDQAPPSG